MKVAVVSLTLAILASGCSSPPRSDLACRMTVAGSDAREEPFDFGAWQSVYRDLDVMAVAAYYFSIDHPERPSATVEEISSGTTRSEYIEARKAVRDRWGTPVRIDYRSGSDLTVRSAGPDRKFDTEDDRRVSTTNWQ